MMRLISPRWRKGLRDLWLNKFRTLLVIVAIAIGVFGLGMVLNSYAILNREMDVNYMRTNPASATFYTNPLNETFLEKVRSLPEIAEVEARRTVIGRIQVGPDEWKVIGLFVIPDFSSVRLGTFWPEEGEYPPAEGDILLERAVLSVANAKVGQTVMVKVPGSQATRLQLTGTVHAPGLAPGWMEGSAYGFITPSTLRNLGVEPYLNELKILVADNPMDEDSIRQTAYGLKAWMEQNGQQVYRIEIPEPGKHPHSRQMATLLFLLEAFGVLALLLSGVLTANMISALLSQQIRQIGVMKAVGANTQQITGLYFGLVAVLGIAGLMFGMPLAFLAGRSYAIFAAKTLNFRIFNDAIPFSYYALQVAAGVTVPLLAATFPILRGSRVTVREAISDYGITDRQLKGAGILRLPANIASRPFLLSLRNTFRRTGRLLLTLITLAFGGAGFIVAMNVTASVNSTVDAKFDAEHYDLQIGLNQPYPISSIKSVVSNVPSVVDLETWGGAMVSVVLPDGSQSNTFKLIAPPAESRLMASLPVVEGRWLASTDKNAMVANHALLVMLPEIEVGDEVTLVIDDRETTWEIVGVVQEIMAPPVVYVTNEYLDGLLGLEGYARNIIVVTENRDPESVAAVARQLEARLADEGFDVVDSKRLADSRKSIEDHLRLLASFLVIMSVQVLVIGGLGLISSMSINVLERRREIGVLRAIGASTKALIKIIITEGTIIGSLSWLLAVILSWPLSKYISYTFGMTFFEAQLLFAVSPMGMAAWLAVAIGFAALSSFYPAWSACRLTVSQTLGYE